jgi:hypothetical protein
MQTKSSFSHPAKSSPVSLLRAGKNSAPAPQSIPGIYRAQSPAPHLLHTLWLAKILSDPNMAQILSFEAVWEGTF